MILTKTWKTVKYWDASACSTTENLQNSNILDISSLVWMDAERPVLTIFRFIAGHDLSNVGWKTGKTCLALQIWTIMAVNGTKECKTINIIIHSPFTKQSSVWIRSLHSCPLSYWCGRKFKDHHYWFMAIYIGTYASHSARGLHGRKTIMLGCF